MCCPTSPGRSACRLRVDARLRHPGSSSARTSRTRGSCPSSAKRAPCGSTWMAATSPTGGRPSTGSLSGTLAFMCPAVPYAIGAKFDHPDRPVLALVGDGAMQMNGMAELITIAHYRRLRPLPRPRRRQRRLPRRPRQRLRRCSATTTGAAKIPSDSKTRSTMPAASPLGNSSRIRNHQAVYETRYQSDSKMRLRHLDLLSATTVSPPLDFPSRQRNNARRWPHNPRAGDRTTAPISREWTVRAAGPGAWRSGGTPRGRPGRRARSAGCPWRPWRRPARWWSPRRRATA